MNTATTGRNRPPAGTGTRSRANRSRTARNRRRGHGNRGRRQAAHEKSPPLRQPGLAGAACGGGLPSPLPGLRPGGHGAAEQV